MKKCLVLLSSFNGEEFVKTQLSSILAQEGLEKLDIVIRDDGSTDNTIDIIEEFVKQGHNIKIFKSSNIGLVKSFCWLIDYAQSVHLEYDYFLFSDQDDFWEKDKIISGINAFESSKDEIMLYCSSSLAVDHELNPIKKKQKTRRYIVDKYSAIIQTFSPGHTYVFKKELLSHICYINQDAIFVHDCFVFSVASIIGNIYYDEKPHSKYRQHSSNQVGTSNTGFINYVLERIKRMRNGDLKKYGRQIDYIYQKYNSFFDEKYKKEIFLFLDSINSFWKRLSYIFKTKLYRQGRLDTFLFKIAYLFGQYNFKK